MANSRRWLILGLLVGLISAPNLVEAASQPRPKGISLSPFERQLTLSQSESAKHFDLTLTNHTASLQELKLSARDFGSLNETGGVLLAGASAYTQKYGLASWINLGSDTVVLPPGQSRSVAVTIDNRSSLQPGGHYGAVVARVTSLADQTNNKVVINQELLSLLFVTKLGGEKYDLRLNSLSHNGNWLRLPTSAKLRFQNPGNVHVIPRGEVRLKSPDGTVIAKGIINSESAYVLPETFRELTVPLSRVGSALPLPGLYHLEAQYRYEGLNQVAVKRFNLQFISLGLYLLLAVLGLVIYWQFRRRKKATPKT